MYHLHEATAFFLTCVLFSIQLIICGFLGVHIVQIVEKVGRRR